MARKGKEVGPKCERPRLTRRSFLSRLSGSIAATAIPSLASAAFVRSRPRRPNIVLIMADDMGFSDLGCYGSEIQTPTINRLAEQGVRFTQFYNAARCCPTRASLLTGLYPHQAGIGDMVGNRGYPSYQGYLNEQCVTIAEVLRAAGYRTLMSGKWHVGERRPHWPVDRGFDRYFGLISGAANYWDISRTKAPGVKRTMAIDDKPFRPKVGKFYMTDAISNYAVKFIDLYGRDDKPFFLYVAYTAPHWPLHAWPDDIAKYSGKYHIGWDELRRRRYRRLVEMGIIDSRWPLTPRDPLVPPWEKAKHKKWNAMRMAVYAAQIDRMDQGIGRIIAKLKEIGILENTLVMFLSDNGGCHERLRGNDPAKMPGPMDTYMSYGRGWANASNTPFRLYKHWVHEGGIATPLIAYWHGVIKPGRLTHEVGHVIDILPTCADVAGAEYPEKFKGKDIAPVEGKSLVPVFEGKSRKGHDALYWEHEGNKAVRKGKWKLVSRYPRRWELYDIEADRSEMKDVSGDHPELVRELVGLYNRWAERCGVIPWDVITKRRKKKARKV